MESKLDAGIISTIWLYTPFDVHFICLKGTPPFTTQKRNVNETVKRKMQIIELYLKWHENAIESECQSNLYKRKRGGHH